MIAPIGGHLFPRSSSLVGHVVVRCHKLAFNALQIGEPHRPPLPISYCGFMSLLHAAGSYRNRRRERIQSNGLPRYESAAAAVANQELAVGDSADSIPALTARFVHSDDEYDVHLATQSDTSMRMLVQDDGVVAAAAVANQELAVGDSAESNFGLAAPFVESEDEYDVHLARQSVTRTRMPVQDEGVDDRTGLGFQWWFTPWCNRPLGRCELLVVKWGRMVELCLALEVHKARAYVDFWINVLHLDVAIRE